MDRITAAVVGNPNCGKTTLFNTLTGARQRVGNWPGVTVERKSGSYRDGETMVDVVDLPGIYALGEIPGLDSLDEGIARDFILSGADDVIVNIADAANLERNLYLTAQLVEMGKPVVVALNMIDVASGAGLAIDAGRLAKHLGCAVVSMVASRGEGIAELKAAVLEAAAAASPPRADIAYGAAVESAIAVLRPAVDPVADAHGIGARWLAVGLLDGDARARSVAGEAAGALLATAVGDAEAATGEDMDMLIADGRYGFANAAAQAAVRRTGQAGASVSDAIDRFVLNRWLGLPLFLAVMYLMFMFTINLGGAFIDFFDIAAATLLVDGAGKLLETAGSPVWLTVLVANGVGGGVQVVATFVPIIGCLYLFLSVLEDSGYMARAAFLMDRFMRLIGLPGKSFVPLIVGFGCNVPAIMASRMLEQQRDRTMTVLMAPFMSCGARLAVYALFAAAFFPSGGQNVVFALYVIGIAAAIATGLVLKRTLLPGDTVPFAMELPPYHRPRLRGVLIQTWVRLKSFIFGAGKIIVTVVVVLSFLNSWGTDGSFGNEDSERSVLSAIGRTIVPAFSPLGVRADNWPATVGIFTGVFAKEAVVGTLSSLYSGLAGNDAGAVAGGGADAAPFDLFAGLTAALATVPANLAALADRVLDPLGLDAAAETPGDTAGAFGAMASRFDGAVGAFAYLLFILLYFPCIATLGAINREIGARWAAFAALWNTAVAYAVSTAFYQAATLARHPVSSLLWMALAVAALIAAMAAMRYTGHRRAAAGAAAAAE